MEHSPGSVLYELNGFLYGEGVGDAYWGMA
jgi:hypothetical protein